MTGEVEIIYDGDCPFCTDFVKVSNIRKRFENVKLTNARESTAISVMRLTQQGVNLDDGMVVLQPDGTVLFGAAAARFITVYGSGSSIRAWAYRALLANQRVSEAAYPVLVFLRKCFFKITRRRLINDP